MEVTHSKLIFEGLRINTILGVYDYEKYTREFCINLQVCIDANQSFLTDNLEDTIDSSLIEKTVIESVSGRTFNLLEHLAYTICNRVLSLDRVVACNITVIKPKCLTHTDSISIEMRANK